MLFYGTADGSNPGLGVTCSAPGTFEMTKMAEVSIFISYRRDDDALREQPRFHASFRVKVALCGLLGQSEEGRDWLVRLLDLQPGLTITAWLKHTATFLAPGTRERMVKGFRKAGLPEE